MIAAEFDLLTFFRSLSRDELVNMLGKCCEHLSVDDLPHLMEIRTNIQDQITKFENIDGMY